MVDPIIGVAACTAGLGLWVAVTGRAFRGLPKWPLQGAALRAAGVYDVLGSLVAIGLAVSGSHALAFGVYALMGLVLVSAIALAPRLESRS